MPVIRETVHEIKSVPPYFQAVWDGVKQFDLRKNDRDYQVGDVVEMREYEQEGDHYTGRVVPGS